MKTKDLVLIAFYSALFGVLEYITVTFSLFKMPQGGSVSISVIALILASYHLGVMKSLIVSLISFLFMFMVEPPVILNASQFMFDYIIAYMVYSLSVLIPDLKAGGLALPLGVIFSNFLRFMCHNIAGWVFFAEYYPGNVLWGVMAYNAVYMVPTMIVSFIIVTLVRPKLEKNF
ncbi:thiamine transporter [Erysipelothrix sp. HDW6A]|uniref:energy-coupled thiamine transporter ThiT n=1 Tax=Erysipelothrix sp. HDW6A TaxID=2714928 RepID=UPI00140DE367|nr:energy-coupled thiamine transporter ThiT [Erysipelothrix sp. HDW6A]QIK57681.1 thiamine transporter [Erysipelothrix sp. HDW6A]